MVVLGIDPGLANTGWGIIEKSSNSIKMLDCGVIKTSNSSLIEERLFIIQSEIEAIIKKYKPIFCGIEELFFAKNRVSAMPVSEALGVLLFTMYKNQVRVKQLTPIEIKQTLTGAGRADKDSVANMVHLILGHTAINVADHATDALAAAIAAVNYLSFEKKVENV